VTENSPNMKNMIHDELD